MRGKREKCVKEKKDSAKSRRKWPEGLDMGRSAEGDSRLTNKDPSFPEVPYKGCGTYVKKKSYNKLRGWEKREKCHEGRTRGELGKRGGGVT